MSKPVYLKWLHEVELSDLDTVGGKNASLGEMIQNLEPLGISVPGGFVVTVASYDEMSQKYGQEATDVAVRSSATAEDLPDASFAGQQETYLNIRGHQELISAVPNCFASLFTDRAIVYRESLGYDHFQVGLSVGIQKMVRSDVGSSGVAFSLDTESGFKDVMLINGSYGLGEMVVQGAVSPDEFLVELGIDSISVTPDSLLKTKRAIAAVAKQIAERTVAATA